MAIQQFINGESNLSVRTKINANFVELENAKVEVLNILTSTDAAKALSANQGRILKGFIDTINTLLNSNDSTLDTLQEIVTYVKAHSNELDALSIGNIGGLTDALALKVDKDGTKVLTDNNFTSLLLNKLNGIATGAQVNTVNTVAGKTGTVSLVKGDVGLGSVDNTSDAAKPISTATQTALNAKAATNHTHNEHDIIGVRVTATVSGTYAINWNAGSVFKLTMAANTTFSSSNLPSGTGTKVIEIILSGNFAPTFPGSWVLMPDAIAYDGTKINRIQVDCINGTGEIYYDNRTTT